MSAEYFDPTPDARELLLLCDGGGSNGSRTHIFKQDLQQMVNELGVSVRVAHYPAYCSKYNPIERRLFSHVTRACQGVLFDALATVRSLMEKTSTRTGFSATARVIEKIYETGRKASEAFRKNMPIVFDDILPKWNYRVVPQPSPAKILVQLNRRSLSRIHSTTCASSMHGSIPKSHASNQYKSGMLLPRGS